MRTIKFRGKTQKGKLVYGNYYSEPDITNGKPFYHEITTYPDSLHSARSYTVDGESVAQLVGTDKNGNEVYEGDVVTNPVDGTTFKAAMNHIYTVKSYTLKQD